VWLRGRPCTGAQTGSRTGWWGRDTDACRTARCMVGEQRGRGGGMGWMEAPSLKLTSHSGAGWREGRRG